MNIISIQCYGMNMIFYLKPYLILINLQLIEYNVKIMRDDATNENLLILSPETVVLYADAGLDQKNHKGSIKMVALKVNDDLLHAYGSPIHFIGKAVIAEALAIRKAIQLAV